MQRLAEQGVDRAALVELRGILQAVIGAAAAFHAVPAGELVDLEQIAVVEDQALRILVRDLFVGDLAVRLVGAGDYLNDRLERLRSPGLDVDQRITVLHAHGRHEAHEAVVAGLDEIRHAGLIADRGFADVAAQDHERGPGLTQAVDEGAPPGRLGGRARIGPGHAAQQATGRNADRRIGRHAGVVGDRGLADGVELGRLPGKTGDIGLEAQLAAQHRLREHAGIVDHRGDDRELALIVGKRQAVEIHHPCVEIGAVAAADEIQLRGAGIGDAVAEIFGIGEMLPIAVDLVILEQHLVG